MATLDTDGKKIWLYCSYEDRILAKQVPGYSWDKKMKCWKYPVSSFNELKQAFPGAIIKPEVAKLVHEKAQFFERLKNYKKSVMLKSDLIVNSDLRLPLYRHQNYSYTFGEKMLYFADFSEPGTGKTAVQIAIIQKRLKTGEIKRALVVCPKSIMEAAWKRDFAKFAPEITIQILTGGSNKIRDLLKTTDAQVYIINYEAVWRIFDAIAKKKFQQIICDESTKIKNRTAKQTKAIIKLSKNIKYRSIMTGTPTPNNLLDIFSQMLFLDEELLGKSFYSFREKYFHAIDYMGFDYRPRPGAAEKIREIMYLRGIRFDKKDCLDLPPLTVEYRTCQITGEILEKYREMERHLITELQETKIVAANTLTKLLRLNMITSGFIKDTDSEPMDFTKQPKIELLKELLESINDKSKIIIWAIFRHDIEKIHRLLGDKSLMLYGATKDKDKTIQEFKNSKSIKYLIAHPATAGHGLTLTEASYAIYYSVDYSFERYYQSVDRINRIGQKNKMTVYHLVCENTIDEDIFAALSKKEKINSFIAELKNKVK